MSHYATIIIYMNKRKYISPYSRAVMIGVLAYVSVLPTGYFGYQVFHQSNIDFVTEFDNRYHRVIQVIDGDTIRLASGDLVRLLGIDAPEHGQCGYDHSKQILTSLIQDHDVYLDKDEQSLDQTGRLLRYVFIRRSDPTHGDVHINKYMIEQGHAQSLWISPNRRYVGAFEAAENRAQEHGGGIWSIECAQDYADSLRQQDTVAPSGECLIKGNMSEKGFGKIYFLPACSNYNTVKIDPTRGEQYFCSEESAQAAGWQRSGTCPNQ